MVLMRREEYPDGRFTLAFVRYGDERNQAVLELTHNWDRADYERGDAFGHIALAVDDAHETAARLVALGVEVTRPPGPMKFGPSPQVIAFIKDPDGYLVELVEDPQVYPDRLRSSPRESP